jgi:hypothetical protein
MVDPWVTALVLKDLLGGELLLARVTVSGQPVGWHYWNRPAGGVEVDLTGDQFGPHEQLGQPRIVTRPHGPPRRGADQYALLHDRVLTTLTSQPASQPQRRSCQPASPQVTVSGLRRLAVITSAKVAPGAVHGSAGGGLL